MWGAPVTSLPTSRAAAAAGGFKHYAGRPCRHGHSGLRYTSTGHCKPCGSVDAVKYAERHPEKITSRVKKWRVANVDRRKAYSTEYRAENQSAIKAATAHYRATSDKPRAWQRNNPEYTRAMWARRHAAKISAMPQWADRSEIRSVYAAAVALQQKTGIPHDVDHIIPLISPVVCGLHVAWNLRAIPAAVNRSKGNKIMDELCK